MSLNAHLFGILFESLSVLDDIADLQNPYPNAPIQGLEHWDINADGVLSLDEFVNLGNPQNWVGYPPHSFENTRLVALNDSQLVFLLSLIRKTEFPEAWYMAWGDGVAGIPTYPSQPLNAWAYGRVVQWLEDLKEQLMVDIRPQLDAMVAAQNEMSDDLDAIRIAVQEIAADIEAGNNAERLEEIANTIGLLVALL